MDSVLYYRKQKPFVIASIVSLTMTAVLLISSLCCIFLLTDADTEGNVQPLYLFGYIETKSIVNFLLLISLLFLISQTPRFGVITLDIILEQYHFDLVAIGGDPEDLLNQNKHVRLKTL